MNNVYKTRNFTPEDIKILEQLYGYFFWKVLSPKLGVVDTQTMYAWHNTWKPEQRVVCDNSTDLFEKLSGVVNNG